MSKTVLQNIQLINWYGFHCTRIPVSKNLTLISGENECGKSTILDAIKYAYTGDTQFNKATSGYNTGVGKRNLISYTRCLVDASAGIYARPADKIPAVYTHIALEYLDQINERPFVLGVLIETAISDIRSTYWYVLDGKRLEEVSFVYEEAGVKKPYDASGFQKKHGIQMKNKKDGIALFMQMTGLKLPYQEVAKYQRKLRNIMAYNPAAKIQEFIKESVLEERDINFDKLKEAKKNIEQINGSLEQIRQELQDLDSILADYDERDKKSLQLKIDDIKIKYKALLDCRKELQDCAESIKRDKIEQEILSKTIVQQDREVDELERTYTEARRALLELDVSKAIAASEQTIAIYGEQLLKLEEEKEKLELFQRQIQKLLRHLEEEKADLPYEQMLKDLSSRSLEASEKQSFIDRLKEEIRTCRDALIEHNILLKKDLEALRQEWLEQSRIIENCQKNKADYSDMREQQALIQEINQALKKRGISEEARMACEYVAELRDESWRDAIEGFLGIHRYAVIVPKDLFDIANTVLDQSGHRHVELVNTRRLMARSWECEEDSVFHYLHIQNETAANYFKFWLGKIHGVPLADVPNYDNAMSKEGKLSRNMAVSYIHTKRMKHYCLGSRSIELNRQAAEKRQRELEVQEKELLEKQKIIQEKAEDLQKGLDCFKEFSLSAHREWEKTAADLEAEKKNHKDLWEAQKNNAEFIALNEHAVNLGRQLEERKNLRKENIRQETILKTRIEQNEKSVKLYRQQEVSKQEELELERSGNYRAAEKAIEEYEGYLSGQKQGSGLLGYETKKRVDRRVRELEGNIYGKQQAYNNRKQETDKLPMGLECEAAYQKRRGKIWVDDLQGIQQKLKEQTTSYERIFKREFVLSIYEAAKDARSDIRDINRELQKLRFSTRYQFDVKMLADSSDYAKVLRYAQYLQETGTTAEGQMSLAGLTAYNHDEAGAREGEIRDIINKLIEHNDTAEMKKFADYRNYMSYEIIINNDEVKDGKLSKQVGYNSGAGTQISYTLILSAALSMLYNARVNSVRLIFIDEPFEKMSDHNIKLMLDFFKNQDFQVIFCAPPNKLESIGSECGVIIPVLKCGNDNMQIGKVKFHERSGV